MPITKAIVTKVFDPDWAPIGTPVRITSGKTTIGIVDGYSKCFSEMHVLIVYADDRGEIDNINTFSANDLDEDVIIERLIPESKDTVDLEYTSLMNKCNGIADRTIKDSECVKFAQSAVIPIDRDK